MNLRAEISKVLGYTILVEKEGYADWDQAFGSLSSDGRMTIKTLFEMMKVILKYLESSKKSK